MARPEQAPESIESFHKYMKQQTQLREFLGGLWRKLEKGEELATSEQKLVVAFANEMQGGLVAAEFMTRLNRRSVLDSHFTTMVSLAPFTNPAIAELLEGVAVKGRRQTGWVLSADIRNSTELMRQATDAPRFAQFLSSLSEWMKMSITYPCGYFDKFTGDGCLAFFPDSLTDGQGELFALDAAVCCQNDFEKVFQHYQSLFAGPVNTGLGVGLEYGEVEFVEIANERTFVGEAVVWACRLSGAPAKRTYLSKKGMERVLRMHPQLESAFLSTSHVMKPDGEKPVGWWKGDLPRFDGLELKPPSWYRQYSPDVQTINKTKLEVDT